jgi:hypothetical protein
VNRKYLGAALIVVVAALAFAIGDSYGQRTMLKAMSPQFDGVQAMLAYNRLDDDRKLGVLLSKGCVSQAQGFLDFDEDQQTRLLSEFFRGQVDQGTIKYVTDRDPKLVASLPAFKSKYGSRWEEPDCK